MTQNNTQKTSLFNCFLNVVEVVGNKLPHPVALFFILAVIIVLVSGFLSSINFSAVGELVNKASGKLETQTITVVSLLNAKGIIYMLTTAEKNFISFAPLGTVLVAMLGVGVAESSGYIPALLRRTVAITPSSLITPVVIFLGVMSNIASDAGYVILIPIGALMFKAYGRHPLAGLAAAFAGVSGGFSANLLIGTLDPLLSGISTEASHILDINRTVEPTANWYFLIVSTFLITIVGTLVTDYIVEPRLGKYNEAAEDSKTTANSLTADENKALKYANIGAILFLLCLVALCIPAHSILRNPLTGSLVANAPLMNGIIIIIMFTFFLPGVIYGYKSKSFKNHTDVCVAMNKAMSSLGPYMALCFMASQFINYFNYTHLGTIIALKGAHFLEATGIGGIALMVLFIIFSALINLFMGSASAKWAILSPIFIPMFMLLGYSPELTQVAYRIGDSCTNLITPLMSYYAMIIVFAKKYEKDLGMGTLISTMLPYSICFMISWSLLLVIWMFFKLPIGPGAELYIR